MGLVSFLFKAARLAADIKAVGRIAARSGLWKRLWR